MGVAKVEDFAADGRLSARNATAHKIVMTHKGLVKALWRLKTESQRLCYNVAVITVARAPCDGSYTAGKKGARS